MSEHVTEHGSICHYFVDEAGDGTIFDSNGNVLIGTQGCSRFFSLGLLEIDEPAALASDMEALRKDLLNDPYFRDVPSMQPNGRKTALMFHAKDDVAEVRREVFGLLQQHSGLRFFAVVRDKRAVLREVQTYRQKRYHPNSLYDQLVSQLFKDRLHSESAYQIVFATRGRSDRTQAFRAALEDARKRFRKKWGINSNPRIDINAEDAVRQPGLQAADYFLWALQRCFERRDDRYITYLWPQCHLVLDRDDTRVNKYGVYYTQKSPLTANLLPHLE